VSNTSKISAADWANIGVLYARGEKSVRELAKMYGVNPSSIHEGLTRRGVKKGGQLQDVTKEAEDEAAKAHRERVASANASRDRYTKYIELIAQLTVKKIADANTAGTLAAVNGDVITLKNAIATIAKARQENWDINKIAEALEQDEELAVLNVGEYSEEELEAIRAANEEAYTASIDDVDDLLGDDTDGDDEDDDEDPSA
jgi:transposase-like protein